MQLPEGEYYFDIELINKFNGGIYRLCTMKTTIIGGPTNRHVNALSDERHTLESDLPFGDGLNITILENSTPITIISPLYDLDLRRRVFVLEKEIEELKKKI